MKLFFIIAICIVSFIPCATAQSSSALPTATPTPTPTCTYCTVTVSGNVADTSGNPIADASITLLSTPKTTTDSQGNYSFTMQAMTGNGCPAGDTFIYVDKAGFERGSTFISVNGCASQTHNFKLNPAQPTPAPTLTGDVNGSGTVDIVDALLVAQYYIGMIPQPFDPSVADVNCDGKIDIIDALRIAQYYIGMITALC
jgi:hypothetical protein